MVRLCYLEDGAPSKEEFSKDGFAITHMIALLCKPLEIYEVVRDGGIVLKGEDGKPIWQRFSCP